MTQAERFEKVAELFGEIAQNWTDKDQEYWDFYKPSGISESLDSVALNLAYYARALFVEAYEEEVNA